MITQRRHDLDWLRIFAFGILIYFHTAIIFMPGGLPLIQNSETSDFLETFVTISSQFRLSLLFFISGVGVAFARRRRSRKEFLIERSKRLLVPLAIGIVFIVPLMVYTEKLFLGQFQGGFLTFYSQYYTQGVYPAGNLSWHHFWFIAYLYLFCLLGNVIFPWLERRTLVNRVSVDASQDPYLIYLPILPLLVIELLLRPLFPGFRDLIHDWASFFHWFLIFVCGYLIAQREDLLNLACRFRYLSLLLAAGATGLLYVFFGGFEFQLTGEGGMLVLGFLAFSALRVVMIWSTILACLGLAGRYFRFSSSVLSYLNEAVYPLFILHLLFIVVLGYWAVQLEWGLWSKYFFIANTTALLVLVCYHFLIRPFAIMRFLFGVRGMRD